MSLSIVIGPSTEPVTRTEAKAHLRIDFTDDDATIDGLIAAARRKVETDARRQLITSSLRLTLDEFPYWTIEPHKPPLQSVTSLSYIDTSGVTQALTEDTDFTVDTYSEPGRVVPLYGTAWPATRDVENAVTLVYVAGYGSAVSVPESYKQAMLLLIAHWYENREAVLTGTASKVIELGYRSMLAVEDSGSYA